MEIEGGLASFLAREEENIQPVLDGLLFSHPRLADADLGKHLTPLLTALYEAYGESDHLLNLMIHGIETTLPPLVRGGEMMLNGDFLKGWLLLAPFLNRKEALPSGELRSFLTSWDGAIRSLPDARTRRDWLDQMAAPLMVCERKEEAFALGRLAAWTLGMAEWRIPALDGCELLSDRQLASLFPYGRSQLESARENPWAIPGDYTGGRLGGFAGYGGPFLLPPHCRRLEGTDALGSTGLILHDQRRAFLLFSDSFGSRLIPFPFHEDRLFTLPGGKEKGKLKIHLKEDSHYLWVEVIN